jgi:hypothetical protein
MTNIGRQRLGELRQDPLCRRLRDRNGVGHNGQVRTFWSDHACPVGQSAASAGRPVAITLIIRNPNVLVSNSIQDNLDCCARFRYERFDFRCSFI